MLTITTTMTIQYLAIHPTAPLNMPVTQLNIPWAALLRNDAPPAMYELIFPAVFVIAVIILEPLEVNEIAMLEPALFSAAAPFANSLGMEA